MRTIVVALLVCASVGAACLDAVYPPFAGYVSVHQIVSGIALQVFFLAAGYLVFDAVVERREQARWRRVAEAAVEDLVSSAQALLDVVKLKLVAMWANGPYADDAEDAEVLRDVLRSHRNEGSCPDLARGVRAASDELQRAFRTWSPALAGTASLDPVLSRVPDVVSAGTRLASAMDNNVAFGGTRSRNGYIDECVIAYEQYLSDHALLCEAATAAGLAHAERRYRPRRNLRRRRGDTPN